MGPAESRNLTAASADIRSDPGHGRHPLVAQWQSTLCADHGPGASEGLGSIPGKGTTVRLSSLDGRQPDGSREGIWKGNHDQDL